MSVRRICHSFEMSPQAYYKKRAHRVRSKPDQERELLARVSAVRRTLPRVGTRKLYHLLGPDIGRDGFFALLKRHGLLIKPKRRFAVTTQSDRFSRWTNLIRDYEPQEAEALLVSDLTYIKGPNQDYYYAALVTDATSRKIMGYDMSASLAPEGALRALDMALSRMDTTIGVIHHSDRGFQYNSRCYVDRLESAGLRISMTERNHCYENALAERVNGILKHEFMLKETFPSLKEAKKALDEAVHLYNTFRPHLSLDYQTPQQVHQKLRKNTEPKSVNFS